MGRAARATSPRRPLPRRRGTRTWTRRGTGAAPPPRAPAPRRTTRDMYVDAAGNAISSSLTGHHSVAVPGTVAGMYEAHHKFGRLPWKETHEPALPPAPAGYLLARP